MNSNRKKILYIHHGWGIGGAPLSLLYLIQKLDKNKYYPKVLFLYDSDAVELFRKENIEYIIANKFNRFFNHTVSGWVKFYRIDIFLNQFFCWFMTAFFYAKWILKIEQPDIIHLNSSTLSAWIFGARRLNIKTIIHIREPIANGYFGIRKKIILWILKKYSDEIIAISKDNAKRLNLPNKTKVIYNFIDFNYFNKKIKPSFQISNKKKYVLYLGGSNPIKGFNVILDTVPLLDEDIVVLFAGAYTSKSFMNLSKKRKQDKINLINKSPNSKFIGKNNNIPALFASCTLLVFPAILPHFARPIIEAGAMAKPIVASNLEGMSEIVEDRETGLLVPPSNPKELAIAINNICADEQLAKRMGEAGYKQARELFDADINAIEIFKLYE